MRFIIVLTVVLITTISTCKAKPVDPDNTQIRSEEDAAKSEDLIRESHTVPVEVIRDVVTESELFKNAEEVKDDFRSERSMTSELHLDELELKSGVDITEAVSEEERSSDVGPPDDIVKTADFLDDTDDLDVRFGEESEAFLKTTENTKAALDVDDNTDHADDENLKEADLDQSIVDDEETVEKFGEESYLEEDDGELDTRRSFNHPFIDTKARSGFEAVADESGNVRFTEDDTDDDLPGEVRSAQPLESDSLNRPPPPIVPFLPQPLAPLVRPNLLLKPVLTILPPLFTFPNQGPFKPYRELHPEYQTVPKTPQMNFYSSQNTPQFQNFLSNVEAPNSRGNAYPYAPFATTTQRPVIPSPKLGFGTGPVVPNPSITGPVIPSPGINGPANNFLPNFDQLFFKWFPTPVKPGRGIQYSSLGQSSLSNFPFNAPSFPRFRPQV